MSHLYEYSVITKFLSPVALGGSPDFSEEPAQLGLLGALQQLVQQLPTMIDTWQGGGWIINSHNITFSGETVIVSILLQRPQT